MNTKLILPCCALAFCSLSTTALRANDTSLITSSGFEDIERNYFFFVAGDSKDMKCTFTESKDAAHSGGKGALLQSADFARLAIGPAVPVHPLAGGERYRIGVWIKPGPDFVIQPRTAGAVLRLAPSVGNPPTAVGSTIFINRDQTVSSGIAPNPITTALSADWTHLEAVVEVPEGADASTVALFMWKAKGTLYVDDFTFEKVDSTTPVTTVVAGLTP